MASGLALEKEMEKYQYSVYQFTETGETCVLPRSWVTEGQVKYDSRKASEYVKKGKMPYKKWPSYKIEPICDKMFDSYDAAYKAESILLNKSELETTDIEGIDNPVQILNKKRRRISKFPNSDASDFSSEDDVESNKLPPIKTTVDIHEITNNETEIKKADETFHYKDIPMEINEPIIQVHTDFNDNIPLSLSTEQQVDELKQLIVSQNNLIQEQNQKIDNLTVIIGNMSKQLRRVQQGYCGNGGHNVVMATRWDFPMTTLEDIKTLEQHLESDVNGSVNEFRSYLLQLGGSTLKTSIKYILKEIYSLELQQKLNFSGRENKFSTKNLIQTKVILEVMQRNTSKTQVVAINEYMYHLQHVTDHVRALSGKTN